MNYISVHIRFDLERYSRIVYHFETTTFEAKFDSVYFMTKIGLDFKSRRTKGNRTFSKAKGTKDFLSLTDETLDISLSKSVNVLIWLP